MQGVGGTSRARRGMLKSFTLGSFRFEDLPANFNLESQGLFGSSEVAGVLGAGMISRFRVTIDYLARRLWLSATEEYQQP